MDIMTILNMMHSYVGMPLVQTAGPKKADSIMVTYNINCYVWRYASARQDEYIGYFRQISGNEVQLWK